MNPFTIGGQQYKDFTEAWDAYYEALHGSTALGSDTYHIERKAFLSGAISAINVFSVRINALADKPITMQKQMSLAVMSTLNEAMHLASEEFGGKQ